MCMQTMKSMKKTFKEDIKILEIAVGVFFESRLSK